MKTHLNRLWRGTVFLTAIFIPTLIISYLPDYVFWTLFGIAITYILGFFIERG